MLLIICGGANGVLGLYFDAVFVLAAYLAELPRQEMGATVAWSGPCIGDPYIYTCMR